MNPSAADFVPGSRSDHLNSEHCDVFATNDIVRQSNDGWAFSKIRPWPRPLPNPEFDYLDHGPIAGPRTVCSGFNIEVGELPSLARWLYLTWKDIFPPPKTHFVGDFSYQVAGVHQFQRLASGIEPWGQHVYRLALSGPYEQAWSYKAMAFIAQTCES